MRESRVGRDPTTDPAMGCGFLSRPEIDAAIEGALSDARRHEFERHLEEGCAACLLLVADLEVYRSVIAGGALEGERNESDRQAEMLRVRLRRELRQQKTSEPRGRAGVQWRAITAVAASLILALAAWFTLRGPEAPTIVLPGGATFEIEVESLSAPPVLRDEQSLLDLWQQAERAFNAQRFSEAERVLAEIEQADSEAVDAALYRGVCQLMMNRVSQAREVLARARAAAESEDLATTSISWYEALAALADDDLPAARRALERARDGGGTYAAKAEDLLTRLGP